MIVATKPRRRAADHRLAPPSLPLPLVGMSLLAGFEPAVAGFVAGFKGSPIGQTPQPVCAGQPQEDLSLAGFAGLGVRSYAREKTEMCGVRACVGVALRNPQTPQGMINKAVACADACGVWVQRNPARNPAVPAANPAAQPQPNPDPDGRRPR